MTKPALRQCVVNVLLLCLSSSVIAQSTRAFNQNASRSNHTRLAYAPVADNGLYLSLNGSRSSTSSDSVAKTGSFMPSLSLQYYSGCIGFGIEGGGFNSSSHFNIAEYTKGIRGFTTTNIASTEWRNIYVVAGPSFRKNIGDIYFNADIHGGFIKMKSPSFSIIDNETRTPVADFNSAIKTSTSEENPLFAVKPGLGLSWFPGGGIIGFNFRTSYLQAVGAKEISVYNRDLSKVNFNGLSQQEIRAQVMNSPIVETKTKGPASNIAFGAGITVQLSQGVKSPRDAASGLATGKRNGGREAGSGIATGRRQYRDHASGLATGKRQYRDRDAASGQATGKRIARDAASGMATGKRVLPTVNKRESVVRQTPNTSFGERTTGTGTGWNIIAGTISFTSANAANGIVTNKGSNPLYEASGLSGNNPLHKDNARTGNISPLYDDHGLSISLVDLATDETLAETTAEQNGDFYFGNVPAGSYVLVFAGNAASSQVRQNNLYVTLSFDQTENTEEEAEIRRRVEVLKSNKTGDPSANRYVTPVNIYKKNKYYSIDDEIEIILED